MSHGLCPVALPAMQGLRQEEGGDHLFGAMANDDNRARRPESASGFEDPTNESSPSCHVSHLGEVGHHPLPLPGGEDDDMDRQRHLSIRIDALGGAGLEPALTGPKPAVLPVTPPPNGACRQVNAYALATPVPDGVPVTPPPDGIGGRLTLTTLAGPRA